MAAKISVNAKQGYKVVESASIATLERHVQLYQKEGWQVQGGVAVCYASGPLMYYQALTITFP